MFDPNVMLLDSRYGYISVFTTCDYRRTPAHILWNPLRWTIGIGRGRPCAIVINKGGRAWRAWANFNWQLWKRHWWAWRNRRAS